MHIAMIASLAMGLSASEADALALAHRMRAGLAHQTRDRWWRDLRFYRQCFLGADAVQVRVRNQTVETVASQSRQSLVHVLGLLIRFPGNDGPGGYRQCPRPGTYTLRNCMRLGTQSIELDKVTSGLA